MKFLTALFAACYLTACTTTQVDEGLALAKPIASAAVGAAANSYLPGSGPLATLAFNDIWGAIAAQRAGQPLSAGTVNPAVGTAIAAQIPARTSKGTILTALTTAAGLVAQQQTTP